MSPFVAEAVSPPGLGWSKLEPIAREMRRLLADPAEIDRTLKDGAGRARAIATPIMDEIKKRVGFIS